MSEQTTDDTDDLLEIAMELTDAEVAELSAWLIRNLDGKDDSEAPEIRP